MNIDNLAVDKPYSWKEICELIGISYSTSGKTRANDIDKLAIELQKENKTIVKSGSGKGTKYTIVTIAIKKRRKGNKNITRKLTISLGTQKNIIKKAPWSKDNNTKDNNTSINVPTRKQTFYLTKPYLQWVKGNFKPIFVPNYKELCNLFNMVYYTNTKAKQEQLKELELYVQMKQNINKKGMKGIGYMINKFTDTNYKPMEYDTKYFDLFKESFLMYWLSNGKQELNHYYKKDLFTINSFVNDNYFYNKENQSELAKALGVNLKVVQDYFNTSNKRLTDILDSCLKRMYNVGLLNKYEKSFNILTDSGEYRLADSNEINAIQYAIYRVTQEYGNNFVPYGFGDNTILVPMQERNNMYQIPNLEIDKFTKKVLSIVQETCPYIQRYFSCYAIIFNKESCELQQRYFGHKKPNDLNKAICNSLIKTFINNSKKANENKKKEIRKDSKPYLQLVDINNKVTH